MITTKWNLTGSISGDHELSGEVNKEVEYVIPSTLDLDYEKAKNKPSINGVTLVGNKTTSDLGIENYDDTEIREEIAGKQPIGNYLTEESDPTVASYIKTITQNDISNWNNKSDFSGSYNDASDKPSINGVTLLGNKTADELGITGNKQVFYWDGKTDQTGLDFWTNLYNINKTQNIYVIWKQPNTTAKGIYAAYIYVNELVTNNNIIGNLLTPSQNSLNNSWHRWYLTQYLVFTYQNDVVTNINANTGAPIHILDTNSNYSNPYIPQYPGSPATKKYVDDAITTAISQITDGDEVSY